MMWLLPPLLGAVCGALAVYGLNRRREALRARYLSFIAHELNTPVTALNMTIVNLHDEVFGPVPLEQKPWIAMSREQAARLGDLLGELRDLIHVEFHRDFHPTMGRAQLKPLIEKSLLDAAESISRAGVVIRVQAPDELPQVRADSDRLGRVLSAVLSHARKFRISGPVDIAIDRRPGWQKASFSYAASAAETKLLGHSLDLFFPARVGEQQVLPSSGLGLGFSSRVIKAMGGRFEIFETDSRSVRIEIELSEENPA